MGYQPLAEDGATIYQVAYCSGTFRYNVCGKQRPRSWAVAMAPSRRSMASAICSTVPGTLPYSESAVQLHGQAVQQQQRHS